MPLPSSISDLSTTAGSNSPAGSESPSTIDDYLRVYASYIAQLRDLSQNNTYIMATAGGSANAITASYSPAVITVNDSTVLMFKAASANTGATTFSPNGITAAPIIGQNHSALQGGEFVAGSDVWVQWNSSIGGGSWMLLLATGGAQTATTQAKYNSSNLVATTAFVQAVGLQFSTFISLGSSTTLTATSVGGIVAGFQASPITVTLPAASAIPNKSTITLCNFGATGMTIAAAGADNIYTGSSTPTLLLVPGSTVTLTSNASNLWFAIGVQATVGVSGAFKNLSGAATGTSASAAYTIDEILVSSTSGYYQTLRGVNISPSLSSSGANGLDTGTSLASTWYSVWVIWNGSTTAGLFSLSATSPSMPSGYTHKARIGWVRTDGSGNKYPLNFTQLGRRAQYRLGAGTNVTILPVLANSATAVTLWTALSVSAFVPPTASAIDVGCLAQSSASQLAWCYVVPNNSYPTTITGSNPVPLGAAAYGSNISAVRGLMTLEGSNVYWGALTSGGSTMGVFCAGWEDNL